MLEITFGCPVLLTTESRGVAQPECLLHLDGYDYIYCDVMTGFHKLGVNIQNTHERLCKLKEVMNVLPETAEQSCASA